MPDARERHRFSVDPARPRAPDEWELDRARSLTEPPAVHHRIRSTTKLSTKLKPGNVWRDDQVATTIRRLGIAFTSAARRCRNRLATSTDGMEADLSREVVREGVFPKYQR